MTGTRRKAGLATALLALALCMPAVAHAFDPLAEARNFAKINERNQQITLTPSFQALLAAQNARDTGDLAQILASDPERNPLGNVCAQRKNECAGDVRLYDWGDRYGIATPVLFTARSGAEISGTVWATRAGPEKRPGVVITTGSVQAPETLYWAFAAVLAKHGYVVLTYDVQGQGRSDTFGEGADRQEGVPSQAGQPFYDGTEDGLDFLLSTPQRPYSPRVSCGNANGGTATSHAAKQARRVKAGLNTDFNPLHGVLDPTRIGIAGHSLGAGAVSFIGQKDPRVDAVVALDNLQAPNTASACPARPDTRSVPPITKPALGMSADYGLTQNPFTADPARDAKNAGFAAYRDAGVDSMQVNVRGGTHYEFAFLPGNTAPIPLGAATFRGYDMVGWYLTAWFDRYVKEDAGAQARLLTDRWCTDAREAAVDLGGDGDLYSFYYDSPLDIARPGGGRDQVADLRAGCAPGGGLAADGAPADYDLISDARTPDGPGPGPAKPDPKAGGPGAPQGSGGTGRGPASCRSAKPVRGSRRADRSLRGTRGADRILGFAGNDRIRARGGNDCVFGGRGRDLVAGQAGNDSAGGQGGGTTS